MPRGRVRDLLTRARERANIIFEKHHLDSVQALPHAPNKSLEKARSAPLVRPYAVSAATAAVVKLTAAKHSSFEDTLRALKFTTQIVELLLFAELECLTIHSQRVPLSSPEVLRTLCTISRRMQSVRRSMMIYLTELAVQTQEIQEILDEKLSRRIQALPQELQDAILDFTISMDIPGNDAIHITKKYKPPLGLQLVRKIRDRFAKQYYSGAIFQVADQSFKSRWRGMEYGPRILDDPLWAFNTFIRWYDALAVSH